MQIKSQNANIVRNQAVGNFKVVLNHCCYCGVKGLTVLVVKKENPADDVDLAAQDSLAGKPLEPL